MDDFSVSTLIENIENCNNYLEVKKMKNRILSKLWSLDDEVSDNIIKYWEDIAMDKGFIILNLTCERNILFDIIETYHRTIINDTWADEVGLKYYY